MKQILRSLLGKKKPGRSDEPRPSVYQAVKPKAGSTSTSRPSENKASAPQKSDNTESTTGALLDTCFHQVEYMGVLSGAKNVEGAKAFIDFMLQVPQQEVVSESNYMHPINPEAKAPEALAKFGKMADKPHQVDAKTIAENQQEWLREWSDLMGQ